LDKSSKIDQNKYNEHRLSRSRLQDYNHVISEKNEESVSQQFIRSRKESIRTPSKCEVIPKGPSFRIDSHRNSRENTGLPIASSNMFGYKSSVNDLRNDSRGDLKNDFRLDSRTDSRGHNRHTPVVDSSGNLRKVSFDKLPKESVTNIQEEESKAYKSRMMAMRLNNKRSSLPIQNRAQNLANELNLDFNCNKISMTPDVSRNNSFNDSYDDGK
jgi:hypothetical protein